MFSKGPHVNRFSHNVTSYDVLLLTPTPLSQERQAKIESKIENNFFYSHNKTHRSSILWWIQFDFCSLSNDRGMIYSRLEC